MKQSVNSNLLSPAVSNALVYLRVIAMLFIVICHLFQSYRVYQLSSIFNVGVQVFLTMSGVLYGFKIIENWKEWTKKRIVKLYLPMLLLLIAVIPVLAVVGGGNLRPHVLFANFMNLQGVGDVIDIDLRIKGLNHLWFMTAIMVAYFSFPILQKLRDVAVLSLTILLLLWVIIFVCLPPRVMWGAEWIFLFATGYMRIAAEISNTSSKLVRLFDFVLIASLIPVVLLISDANLTSNYDRLNRIFHVLLGLSLTIWGYKMLKICNIRIIPSWIRMFDKYSFYVYLVHFVFMIGPLSFAHFTPYNMVNIAIMLSLSVLFTSLLVKTLFFFQRVELLAKWNISN